MTSSELPAHVQYSFETPSVGGFLVVFCLDGLFGGFLFVCLGGLGDGVVLVVVGVFPVDFSSLDEVFSICGIPAQLNLHQSCKLPSAYSPYFVLQ